jgi:hypothetical protein
MIFTHVLVHHTFDINFSNLHKLLFHFINLLVVAARKSILIVRKFRKGKPLNYCFVSKNTYNFNRGQLSEKFGVHFEN